MASHNDETSGSSTDSIDFSVRSSYECRSLATQSDFSSSVNSEITNRNDSLLDPLGGNVSPLMFQSQSTESSNLASQAQDPNICRQIFPTESCTTEYSTSGILNPEQSTSGIIHQISSDVTDTTQSETSDSTSNTERVSPTESDSTDCKINTETLTQYARGVETQFDSQEMYPDTMSQSSEGLQRSHRRTVQRYDIASNSSSSSMDLTYDPALEIPPLTRQNAIYIPSTSRKRDLQSTESDEENEDIPPRKKTRKKDKIIVDKKK